MSDIMNLLDANLEDLADMQKFEPLPAGSYRQVVSWEVPPSDDKVTVVMTLEVKDCIEVPDVAEEDLPAVGKKATFWMDLQMKDGSPILWKDGTPNTSGQGMFKEVLKALAPVFNPEGTLSNREVIEASGGAEVLTTLKVKASKSDPDSKWNVIKTLVLAD
jgi:hypothetical protein